MITVTGPTGGVGRRVLDALLEHDEPVRVVTRNPQNLPIAVRALVEVVQGSHADPAVIDRAFDGAAAQFWLVNGDPRARTLTRRTSASRFRRPLPSSATTSAMW